MKLKLHTQNTESLKTTLSLISHVRKFVILKFTAVQLLIILVNSASISQEPQIWCKLSMESVFDQIEIESMRENTILLEINIDLLLQTLRNFDKANSDGLNIRLQRKDTSGGHGVTIGNVRTASLALFYSNVSVSTVNHTFRIPVKILKTTHEGVLVQEPELSLVELIMKLPNEFALTYKRLEKFKASNNELVTIKASRRGGGFLGFILEEEGKYRVTISWNDKLEVQKPKSSIVDGESIRMQTDTYEDDLINQDENEDKEITVKLRDWQMASKIVAICKTVVFLMTPKDGVLHCMLEDSDDVEIVYFLGGVKVGLT